MADDTRSVDGCESSRRGGGVRPRLVHRCLTTDGYWRITAIGHPMANDRGWAPEHRVVAWEHFGPFDPSMHVHHKNHDKLDNRPENLELLTPSEHARLHGVRSIDRAEVVRLYATGLSTPQVAAAVGTHAGKVFRILAAEGVKVLTSAERNEAKYADVKADALAFLVGGATYRATVDRFGVPESRLRMWKRAL